MNTFDNFQKIRFLKSAMNQNVKPVTGEIEYILRTLENCFGGKCIGCFTVYYNTW